MLDEWQEVLLVITMQLKSEVCVEWEKQENTEFVVMKLWKGSPYEYLKYTQGDNNVEEK